MGGQALHFRLAGINNQNFLMRDEETGSWWQQASGKAIFGPFRGQSLELVISDELSYQLWASESPLGQVLKPVAEDASLYESDWEAEVQKLPTVISFPGTGLNPRDLVVGLAISGDSRAIPISALLAQSPVQDRVGGRPVLVVIAPDGKSVRAFLSEIDGAALEFFRKTDSAQFILVDSSKGSEWDFRGCAISGAYAGKCLQPVAALKDYWFDWRNYHPATSLYRR